MVNFDTALFVLTVQGLASRSEYGIFPFSKATPEQAVNGILYDDSPKYKDKCPIVENFFLKEDGNYTLISNSDKNIFYLENGLKFNVYLPEDGDDLLNPWIEISSSKFDYVIVIDNGNIEVV